MGNYQVLGLLGAGGMGEVYRARDTRLARDVALKVLPPTVAADAERLARFEREAHLLASLNHPHIAAIYGVEETGGAPALVLELVEGPTLGDRIAQGPLAAEEAARIALQIAQALEYAHERGVIHRDLKPANVKLDADGNVKVLDFGLAKAISGDPAGMASDPAMSPTVTSLGSMVGAILGTAAYMSPEQARAGTVDRRADIWAFGAVLWEMLTGKRPFEGDTISDTLASVLRAPIEWETLPASTPPAIVKLLRRCLERDPKKRLRDIGEARILLENPAEMLAAAPAPSASLASAAAAPPRPLWRTALPWALFIVTALVAGVALRPRPVMRPDVMRFEIGPPKSLLRINWPRLSPDGKTMAFLGRDETGKQLIWIRPLDSFEAHPLAGTENAGRPFWSPDGRELAFFAGNQLLKISAGGGPTQLVCEANSGADGSWGSSGVILFDGGSKDPIRKCPASGGVASSQIQDNPQKDSVLYAWPFFLPDGRHFLCQGTARGEGVGQTKLYVGSLDDPALKPLVASDSRPEYGSGYLVYVMRNTLVAQGFDSAKLELSGDPVPLAAGVAATNPGDFTVSASGALAYVASQENGSDQFVWVDRKGVELGRVGDPGSYTELALSPDGSRLAYTAFDGTQNDIWVRDLRRGVAMRLTSDASEEVWPVWSPDGSRIAYSSDRDGLYGLWQKSSSGTGAEEKLYVDKGANLGAMNWTPDGRYLAFSAFPQGGKADTKLLPMQGGERKPLDVLVEKAAEMSPAFSPDGRFLAYRSDESGRNEIYVQPYPATGAKWTISNQGGSSPQWRGDGKELFYKAPDDTVYAVPVTLAPVFDAGTPVALFKRRLEPNGIVRNRWVVSADGQKFLLDALVTDKSDIPFSVVLNWTQTLEKR